MAKFHVGYALEIDLRESVVLSGTEQALTPLRPRVNNMHDLNTQNKWIIRKNAKLVN